MHCSVRVLFCQYVEWGDEWWWMCALLTAIVDNLTLSVECIELVGFVVVNYTATTEI